MVLLYSLPSLATSGEFFTDSNGRQFMRRVRNERFSFEFTQEDWELEPATANYYPVTTSNKDIFSFSSLQYFFKRRCLSY